MKVLKFSIGFGPKILYKQGKETEYSLRAIPLGGFVQLEGEDTDSKDERAFMNRPAWQRILVLLAGVTMNVLLALFIYLCIYMNINYYTTSRISSDTSVENLKLAKVNIGDTIYKINNEKIYNDFDIERIIEKSSSDDFYLEIIDPNGNHRTEETNIPKSEIGYVGIVFENNKVYSLVKNGPGEKAGIKIGDELIAIDGTKYDDITLAIDYFKANPNKQLNLNVIRDGKEQKITITTDVIKKRLLDLKYVELKDLDFVHNLFYAWNETKFYLRANFIGIGELLSGNAENVEVQGIVGISKQISSTESFIEFFYLMSAISLSLGIMNLLPIPGLDGGKLLIVLIELIRRKPISKETEAKITIAGFSLLLILMIYVTLSDISKLFK